jgi:ribosomal protein L13E
MWSKRDWQLFYMRVRSGRPGQVPPRPVYLAARDRLEPAIGFSLTELDDAGISLELAEHLGLPVDAGRLGSYGPNVTALRDFARTRRDRP